ncbi:FecR family protein [Flavobacteriaceae bacterium GSB9]|nr:FecR family protein [Flavobacteriaceae bacterium GSB9]
MNKESDILKWFNGEISAEEIKKRYPNDDFSTLEKVGFYSKQFEVPTVDAQQALQAFKNRNHKKDDSKVIPLNFKMVLKVAAVLVVLLTSSYFLFFNNAKTYETTIAQTETLRLPDDSEVVLNAQSKLSFDKKEWKNNRILGLHGEAYFKVTKGKTFIVKTNAGSVQVLGTQFNVKERKNYFEVMCYEGSVKVKSGKRETVLKPGKSFRLVKGDMVVVSDFKANKPSWLAQESSFVNVPLWQVIDELEAQYDFKIDASNVDVSKPYTGTFTHNDKNIALQSVTVPLKLSYKINGKQVELYNYASK